MSDPERPPGALRILGIDPGSRRTGFGVVDRHGSRTRSVAFGVISCPQSMSVPERLARLATELRGVIDEHRPDVAVLESLYHGVNSRSLIVLAQARGALLATVAGQGLEVTEYAPAEVKLAVTGNGRAGKDQVARMVKLALGLGQVRAGVDATDALAVALCFAQRYRIDRLARR